MRLPFHIIEMLERRSEHELRLPSDCEYLSLDIESKTGTHIGATTLKRLLGFAGDERQPHTSTLDVLARYLGYSHWQELAAVEHEGNSGFEAAEGEVRTTDLLPGTEVEVAYLPDRRLLFSYRGNGHYLVTESENSKLKAGDEAEIQAFVPHHPLLVTAVWRDGKSLGPFTAGRVSGLQFVKVRKP